MRLIIGGYAQGKLDYVLRQEGMEDWNVLDGENVGHSWDDDANTNARRNVVLNHFHSWVKERMRQGGCPEKEIWAFLQKYPGCIIISDEIGNGIVPIDAFEREYRERTGRILVELAARADEVVRVICGIGQKIK